MSPKELQTILFQAGAFEEEEIEENGFTYRDDSLWQKFVTGEFDAISVLLKKTGISFERILSQPVYNNRNTEDNLVEIVFKANGEFYRIEYYYDSYEAPLLEYLCNFHKCRPKEITITVWEDIKE